MENKPKIIEVKHLSHRYSVDWAIRDIDFEIDSKGVVGLLGSNGAGKSTTMNIICGVLNQTEGEVLLSGINTRENPIEAKKLLGFLPQRAPLHPDLTVDEYLYHCADIRRIPKSEIAAAMRRAKEKCGIMEYSKRLIKNLSGGYQQRVGIAQSIIHNPPFVVLDEPTNGLDPNQIVQVRGLIREIAEERAVLISTHILPEVQATCDQIKMIEHGRMVFSGSLAQFNNYAAPSTLVAILDAAPPTGELLAIPSVRRVERITDKRMRIHFEGPDTILREIMRRSVEKGWQLSEIFLEKESLDTVFAKLSGK
ncbi:ABC transporter ATP-binding protein [Alistipes sp.]|uniref:ABC transporter ATP-binding protein n=1 Tax=Alistipes sp. TaxID=1872444 RepID=UPI003AEF4A71